MWRKGSPFALLVGMQTGVATVESSVEIPQKIEHGSTFWSSDPSSGNISEGTQNTTLKAHKHPYVAVLFTIAKIWEQSKCPSVDEWWKHLWNIYTMEYYSDVKKEENFTLCDSMDGPGEN